MKRHVLLLMAGFLYACGSPGVSVTAPDYASRFSYEALRLAEADGPKEKADALLDLMEYRLDEMERLHQAGNTEYVESLAASYRALCIKALRGIVADKPSVKVSSRKRLESHNDRFQALSDDARTNYLMCLSYFRT